MNQLVDELEGVQANHDMLQEELAIAIHAISKDVDAALLKVRTLNSPRGNSVQASTSSNSNITDETLECINRIITGLESDPKHQAVTERLRDLSVKLHDRNSIVDTGDSRVVGPPVVFTRIPELDAPLVDSHALEEADATESPPTGLETFLDSMFSNDAIYDASIKKLRDQLVAVHNRNVALELNLDMASQELDYWRSNSSRNQLGLPAAGQSDVREGRKVNVEVWKHAVSKFIGSFDQFSMIRALIHWRLYVREKRDRQPPL